MTRRSAVGFTLIEVMIAIALLAIFLATMSLVWNRSLGWFNREHEYALALQLARSAVEDLRGRPYDSVPPIVLPSSRAGAHKVPDERLVVPGTRSVREVPSRGGSVAVVSYDFEVPVRGGEAARVPREAPYRIHLQNEPVREILDVVRLDAGHAEAVHPTQGAPAVEFDASMAGAVVRVDYLGKVRIVASSRFVDGDMHETKGVGVAKVIRLGVLYGEEHAGALDLSMVKTP